MILGEDFTSDNNVNKEACSFRSTAYFQSYLSHRCKKIFFQTCFFGCFAFFSIAGTGQKEERDVQQITPQAGIEPGSAAAPTQGRALGYGPRPLDLSATVCPRFKKVFISLVV